MEDKDKDKDHMEQKGAISVEGIPMSQLPASWTDMQEPAQLGPEKSPSWTQPKLLTCKIMT